MRNRPTAYVLTGAIGDPGLRDAGNREVVHRMLKEMKNKPQLNKEEEDVL